MVSRLDGRFKCYFLLLQNLSRNEECSSPEEKGHEADGDVGDGEGGLLLVGVQEEPVEEGREAAEEEAVGEDGPVTQLQEEVPGGRELVDQPGN